MKITLKDIFLMDKGTQAYTEFDADETLPIYMMDHPETLDWQRGLIHSHNGMPVFFSGTDWSELNDNSPQHNYYLSVIVNNYLDIEAKIAFTAEQKNTVYTCKNENGGDYDLEIVSDKTFMFVYTCVPQLETPLASVPEEFVQRLTVIEAQYKEQEEAKKKNKTLPVNNPALKGQTDSFPDFEPKKKSDKADWFDGFDNTTSWSKPSIEEEFAIYVMRLGTEIDGDSLEDALEDISMHNLNGESLAQSVLDMYGPMYTKFFEKLPKFGSDEKFLSTLEEVIVLYEEEEDQYEFLTPVVQGLRMMGNRFEKTVKENIYGKQSA